MSYIDIIAFWVPTAVFCVLAFMAGLVFSQWLEHDYKKHWKEWKIKFPLKPLYIGIALVIFVPLVILFSNLLRDVAGIPTNKKITPDQVRTLAIAFVGTISGIGALFAVYLAILRSEENKRQNDVAEKQSETANKQAITAEQGLITDRISKAVEGLGKNHENGEPVLEIRLGAIYALERIAKDSKRDHVPIMELFCTYIRTNSSNNNEDITKKPLREDIKIILTIIRRRHKWEQGKNRLQIEQTQRMYLHFFNCYLKGAELRNANLFDANFYKTNLQNAWLNDVNLNRARLTDVNINGASLTGATTSGAYAEHGDFSGCQTLNQEQIDQMFLGADVKLGKDAKLGKDLIHPQKDTEYYKKYDKHDDFMEAYEEWLDETGY